MKRDALTEFKWSWWYILPIFFDLIGCLIAWYLTKKNNTKLAKELLNLGILILILKIINGFFIIIYMYLYFIKTFINPLEFFGFTAVFLMMTVMMGYYIKIINKNISYILLTYLTIWTIIGLFRLLPA